MPHAVQDMLPPTPPARTQPVEEPRLVREIRGRIQQRLPGRVHFLSVELSDEGIVLSGECCTFYSKQMAQHVAMGVVEYERLINNITVRH
ncbi:MAG: BON domain-containing protein [Planctomycetota bacterium]